MALFNRLFSKNVNSATTSTSFEAPIAPDVPFFAVGDVHGCLKLMQQLQKQMTVKDPTAPIVYIGDYVDRGEDSAGVLRDLFNQRNNPNIICLIGNHEEMMLSFIDQPAAKGERWLRYGGLQTLASFGIGGISPASKGDALIAAASSLKGTIGPDMLTWLRNLQMVWQSGNVAVVHAGADPARSINLQGPGTLVWGHPDFATKPRKDGLWITHGHTIVDEATAQDGRISTDTGAYASGRLTAAYVTSGNVEFLQT